MITLNEYLINKVCILYIRYDEQYQTIYVCLKNGEILPIRDIDKSKYLTLLYDLDRGTNGNL